MSDFVAGFTAGTASCYVGHPFDTIKTLLQLTPEQFNRSAIKCGQTVIRDHGIRALYRGVTLPVTCSALTNAIIFEASERTFRGLANQDGRAENDGFDHRRLMSGVVAGFMQAFFTSPFDLVKCRMQAMRLQQLTDLGKGSVTNEGRPLESLREIVQRLRLRDIHVGLLYTILRDAPAFGLYFYFFHGIKNLYQLKEPQTLSDLAKYDTWFLACTGGLCGCIGWIVSYPIDVLKSQKQVYGRTPKISSLLPGWWYRGLAPTLFRTIPVNMVRFTVYLFVKNNLPHSNYSISRQVQSKLS